MTVRRWRADARTQARVARAVLLALALLAAAAAAGLAGSGPHVTMTLLQMPWWVLAGVFAVTEWGPVPIQVAGRHLHVGLSAAPLAVGLLLSTPTDLVVGMLIGGAAVQLARPVRDVAAMAATLTVAAGQGAVALLVVGLGAVLSHRSDVASVVSGRFLVAATAVLAIAAAGLAGALVELLLARAAAVGTGAEPGPPVSTIGWSVLVVPGLVSVPACAAVLGFQYAEGALPLLVTGAAMLVGYRTHAALGRRQRALERLHLVSDSLAHSADPGQADLNRLVRAVLVQSMGLLQVRYTEVVWPDEDGVPVAWTARPGSVHGPVPAERFTANLGPSRSSARQVRVTHAGDRPALAARGVREAMVAPLASGSVRGHLLVADPTVLGRAFAEGDLRLLVTVANQAAVALANAGLIRRLHHEARADELTGLPNRVFFRELIEEHCGHCEVEDPDGAEPFAVMLLDFDGFKAINDTLGHAAGDDLLRVIAARLAEVTEGVASVARLGGDEFAVVAPGCRDERDSQVVARRLLAVFDAPVQLEQARLRLSGSLGISLFPQHGDNASDLMRRADLAMYAAKAGAGGARLFTEDLLAGDALALTLGGDLRDAVDRDEVEVVVHPVVHLGSEELHSVEVLARWHHPDTGPVDPRVFFAAAEQAGLIPALSVRILHRALRLCRLWLDQGTRVRVAVNVAPRWLADTALPEMVGAALAAYGVPADLLCLELTERGVIADPARVTRTLHRLHDLGVHLAVDDFGTGYSSLGYLSQLPVDQLKIDAVFTSRVAESERDLAIVRSLVDLGRHLKLEVVAEGISSSAVRDVLESVGCPLGQGYLFAHPFEPEQLDDFANGRRTLGVG